MRHVPDTGAFTDLNVVVDECGLVGHISAWSLGRSGGRGLEVMAQRALALLEHGQYPQSFLAVSPWFRTSADTVQKMQTFGPKRLSLVQWDGLGIGLVCHRNVIFPLDGVRIKEQFILFIHIIEDSHFAVTHHNQLLLFNGMEP